MQSNALSDAAADENRHAGILDDFLDDRALAAQLKVSPRTLARWDRLRQGPPITRIGRKKLRHRESVRRWLAEREQTAAA